jgi:FHA domain/Domain of unknown function (DUF4388)
MPASRPLALRFLWGHFQGGLLPLERGRPLVIGRQADADLVIPDDLLSRRHARLAFEGDELVVEDLGSTNGTYVNGARVTRGRVSEGDRLLVGGSIVKVVAAGRRPSPAPAASPAPAQQRAMQGRIEDVPLQDVLQLFASGKKTGILAVQRPGHEARVEIEKGSLVRCVIDGRADLSTRKTLTRLFAWTQGTFELQRVAPAAAPGGPSPEPLQPLLVEAMRELEELRRLVPRLPARFAAGAAPVDDLDDADVALLALAAQVGSREGVLDVTPLSDLEAAQRLGALVARGLLVPVPKG